MTNRRDESTEARVAAVLRGDTGAADRLRAFLSGHALDPTPLRQRAEAELAATRDELEGYRLELFDTLATDRHGKSVLACRFFHRGGLLFAGADFPGTPLHAVDADATVAASKPAETRECLGRAVMWGAGNKDPTAQSGEGRKAFGAQAEELPRNEPRSGR
jgi:hypothetical protein